MSRIRLAETVFDVETRLAPDFARVLRYHRPFAASGPAHAILRDRPARGPDLPAEVCERASNPRRNWHFFRAAGKHVLACRSQDGGAMQAVVLFGKGFREGTICRHAAPASTGIELHFSHPILDLQAVSVLSRRRGIILHGCAVADGDRGYLFLGSSGQGKSTLARLWSGEATILCDERNIIREMNGAHLLFGTFWHGHFRGVNYGKVPLTHLFFIRHGKRHRLRRMGPAEAAASLLSHGLLPFWDPPGLRNVTDLAVSVATRIPCYDLAFAPDPSILDFVRCVK